MTEGSERGVAELLYDHLLDLHGQVFAVERFEAAYHVLAAAMHVAEAMEDVERLSMIERLAETRQAAVDRIQPEHRISSVSSKRRGNAARFLPLAATARAVVGRIKSARATERMRGSGGSTPGAG